MSSTTKRPRRTLRGLTYVRVSDVHGRDKKNDGENFHSPRRQRDRCSALAKGDGARITNVFEDLNQSGGKYDRPELQRALEMIERREADVLYVAYLSRLARNVVDLHRIYERVEAVGGRIVIGDLPMDTTT